VNRRFLALLIKDGKLGDADVDKSDLEVTEGSQRWLMGKASLLTRRLTFARLGKSR